MTTTPSMWIVSRTARMPSTAAWSAASLSPRPIQAALASAAASVTRTSSSARLRSGRWVLIELMSVSDRAGRLALELGLALAHQRAREHQQRSRERHEPAVLEAQEGVAGPGLVDQAVVGDQAERRDRDDHRHLPARPRQRVVVGDDPGEDERGYRAGEQEPPHRRVDIPAREVDVGQIVAGVDVIPGQEEPHSEEDPAVDRDPLAPLNAADVHGGRPYTVHRCPTSPGV